MNKAIDTEKLQRLLRTDSAARERLEASLLRLAGGPGAEINESLLLRAAEEAGIPTGAESVPGGKIALRDEELDSVAGGRVLFNDDGVNRNSWFVSLLSMLMAQDAAQGPGPAQGPLPREISIDGKTYRILRVGEAGNYRYIMEQLR